MSRHQWGLCRAREGDAPFTTPISAAAAPSEHLSATSVPGTLGTELEASSEEMIGEAEEGVDPRGSGGLPIFHVYKAPTLHLFGN